MQRIPSRLAAVGAGLILALVLSQCGGGSDDEPAAPTPPAAEQQAASQAQASWTEGGAGRPATETSAPIAVDTSLIVPVNQGVVDQIGELIDVPNAPGENDREEIRALAGPPDVFVVSYEVVGGEDERTGGTVVRYETWVYLDFLTAFEFADGQLINNLPVEDVAGPSLLPGQYDPDLFTRAMTWDDVRILLADPDAAASTSLPKELTAEFGGELTVYAAEQLLVVFDEAGLVYAETFPLEP